MDLEFRARSKKMTIHMSGAFGIEPDEAARFQKHLCNAHLKLLTQVILNK